MSSSSYCFLLVTVSLLSYGIISFAQEDPEYKTILSATVRDPYVCEPKRFEKLNLNMSDLGFCNKNLSFRVRAKDLVGRMTLLEKVKQLGNEAAGVYRLGIRAYNWWSEALHGVSDIGGGTPFTEAYLHATSFPTVIHTAASFNKTLWNTIGKAISTEARAIYNLGQGGLTFWSPTMNPVRDPRWGRTTETPGEDPYVVGKYSVNFVRGMQDIEGHEHHDDPDSRPIKVSSCCKHYAAYDLDAWDGISRKTYDARVTQQDMIETFQRPFEMCVKEGDVSSVMCSYNKVDGYPTCADPVLLKQTIRDEWKFNGYIVSDCDSVGVMIDNMQWLNFTYEDAVAKTIKAGLDMDCGWTLPNNLQKAVQLGKISEEEVDKALINNYVVLMRLGFFDGTVPSLMSLGSKDICSDEHVELAAQAAREGVVLLKNDHGTLPLKHDDIKKLAVIGPNGNSSYEMLGNYDGNPCHIVSPSVALSAYANVIYEQGCDMKCDAKLRFPQAIELAKEADATVLIMGSDMSIEREELDRDDLYLPNLQNELITEVAASAKGPVILVLMTAGGFDITFAKDNPKIESILWVGHPGMEGGRGIADVIFGKYNPGGRLPITWYPNEYVKKIPMTSMPLRPVNGTPGRTYRFYDGETVFPFGYGLSYTTFSYNVTTPAKVPISIGKPHLPHLTEYTDKSLQQKFPSAKLTDITCKSNVSFEVEVKNEGAQDGSEVVIVYTQPPKGIVGTHIKRVVEFQKVFVPAQQSRKVKFVLDVCTSLGIVDGRGNTHLPSGKHTILLGTSPQSIEVDVSYK